MPSSDQFELATSKLMLDDAAYFAQLQNLRPVVLQIRPISGGEGLGGVVGCW